MTMDNFDEQAVRPRMENTIAYLVPEQHKPRLIKKTQKIEHEEDIQTGCGEPPVPLVGIFGQPFLHYALYG